MKKGPVLLIVVAIVLAAGWYGVQFMSGLGWELVDRYAPPGMTQGRAENLVLPLTRKDTPKPGVAVRFEPNPNFSGLPEGFVTSDADGKIVLTNLMVLSPDDQTLHAVLESGARIVVPIKVTPVSYSLGAFPRSMVHYSPENLVFTLKANGVAVPAETAVHFSANPAFQNLPEDTQFCDRGGKIKLDGVTATAAGSQVITATVNGSPIDVNIHVRPAVYSLTPKESQILAVGVEQALTFEFLQNGHKLPKGTEVSLTYDSDADIFASPPPKAIVDENGLFTLNLTGKTSGEGNITATVAAYSSGSAGYPIEVRLAAYTVGLSLSENSAQLVATVTNHSLPASGQPIDFNWKIKGSSQDWQSGSTEVTDAKGTARYTLTETAEWKTITVRAVLQNDTSQAATQDLRFGKALPRGFIAMHPDKMNWEDAKSYCESQGARLPMAHRAVPCDVTVISIDGFGVGAWPAGLPRGSYWTLGEVCNQAGSSWAVQPASKFVRIDRVKQSVENYAACVP